MNPTSVFEGKLTHKNYKGRSKRAKPNPEKRAEAHWIK